SGYLRDLPSLPTRRSSDLIQHLTAFRLQGVFVEVEERVSVQDNLAGGGGHDRSLSNGYAVATRNAGSGRPEVVAPAQFVRSVHPDVAERVAPVIDGLCGNCTRRRSGCDSECQCDFGGFVHVSPRLSLMLVSDRSEPPPHIKKTEPV